MSKLATISVITAGLGAATTLSVLATINRRIGKRIDGLIRMARRASDEVYEASFSFVTLEAMRR